MARWPDRGIDGTFVGLEYRWNVGRNRVAIIDQDGQSTGTIDRNDRPKRSTPNDRKEQALMRSAELNRIEDLLASLPQDRYQVLHQKAARDLKAQYPSVITMKGRFIESWIRARMTNILTEDQGLTA